MGGTGEDRKKVRVEAHQKIRLKDGGLRGKKKLKNKTKEELIMSSENLLLPQRAFPKDVFRLAQELQIGQQRICRRPTMSLAMARLGTAPQAWRG